MAISRMLQPKAIIVALSSCFISIVVIAALPLPIKIKLVLDPQEPERAEADRKQKHDADEQGLQHRIDIKHDEEIADGAHDEGTEDRANGASRPAEQRGAADDHGSNRVERVIPTQRRLCRTGVRKKRQHQAGNGSKEPRECISK